jgi:hypothetical protein
MVPAGESGNMDGQSPKPGVPMNRALIAALLLSASVAAGHALAQTSDQPPVNMASSDKMKRDAKGGEAWTYIKPKLDLRHYDSVIVDKTVIYEGPDAQFTGIDKWERPKFGPIVTEEVREALSKSFNVVDKPGANVLRIRFTILGVEKTEVGVRTVTQVLPIGLALNAVRSIADKPGATTGSMLFAVEIFDSKSNELQVAAVRRNAPLALDLPASLSTSDTVKAVARDVGKTLREKLETAAGKPPA